MRKKPNEKILKNINRLFRLSKNEVRKQSNLDKRYISLAKKIAKRNNISLKKYKKKFCKKCNSYFIPGKNCEIRIKNKIKIVKCLECGNISRYLIKKKEDRK